MRLPVDRQAFFEFGSVFLDQLVLIQLMQQRPVGDLLPLHPLHNNWYWHIQKDGGAPLVHVIHVIKKTGSAAAGGKHKRFLLLNHLVKGLLFQTTKGFLALLGKDSSDGLLRCFFDDIV